MFGTAKKSKIANRTKCRNTLSTVSDSEFSRFCRMADLFGVQIRDMGSGYSLVKDGRRVGFLPLTVPIDEVPTWIQWASADPAD